MMRFLRVPRFRIVYPLRGLGWWMIVRVLALTVDLASMNAAQSVFVVGFVALTVWLDARRRNEHLFLGNLGIPEWSIPVAALPFPIVLEILVP